VCERRSTGVNQPTHLIISADGGDVNDGVGVVKERGPTVPLATGPTNVIQSPLYCAIVVLYNERVLRDADCLDPSVEHIVDGRDISAFGHPVDLIKEAAGWRLRSVWGNECDKKAGEGYRKLE